MMSHRHLACKQNQKDAKCDNIDCECSTHLSDSSEHVICQWDPIDNHVKGQMSSVMGQNQASCIDTGGIRRSSITPTSSSDEHGPKVVKQTKVVKNAGADKMEQTTEKTEFQKLKLELSETQALLEKTEEQLLHQMDQNLDLEATMRPSAAHRGSGRSVSSDMRSLQDIIGHLYLGPEDAKRLLVTVKSRLEDLGTNITPENYTLISQLKDLQVVLQDIIRVKGQNGGHEVTFDLQQDRNTQSKKSCSNTSRGISVVENLMQKLNNKEDELRRWEVLVEQLNKELEQARLRCESNTNALYNKQEECRQQEEELNEARVKVEQLERLAVTVRSKGSSVHDTQSGQTRTTQTDATNVSQQQQSSLGALDALTAQLQQQQLTASELHPRQTQTQTEAINNSSQQQRTAQGALSALSAQLQLQRHTASEQQTAQVALSALSTQLQQQQLTASELQLEREHNQRLQELRFGVTEAGNRWEKEVLTLDLQVKQLTNQLEEAKKHIMQLEDDKKHQKKHLQEMRDSLKHLTQSRDELLAELGEVKGEMTKRSQRLAAAQTALTYERDSNEKLKEQYDTVSKTEENLTSQLEQSKNAERQLTQQLAEAQKNGAELRKHCTALCSDLEQANTELQDRADNISRLQTEMDVAMTTAKAEMESERDSAKSLHDDLSKTIQAGEEQIAEMRKVMGKQEDEIRALTQTKRKLQEQQSENKQLTETISNLIAQSKELHGAVEEQREENCAVQKQSEAVKRDLEVALVRQKCYKESGILQERKMEEALKRWEVERTQFTNRVTELQVNLKDCKSTIHQLTISNQEYCAAKDRLQERIQCQQEQTHAKDVSLQTMMERLSNTQKALRDEKLAKNEYEKNLEMMKSTLEKKESILQTQNDKVCSLEAMKTNLKAMTDTQKASIAALQKQLKQHQKEFVGYKQQVETNMDLLKERNDCLANDLQNQVTQLEDSLDRSNKRNASLMADLKMMSASMDDKTTQYSQMLHNLTLAEQREGELKTTQLQLTHQLMVEQQTQEAMKKRLEEQETEIKDLHNSAKEDLNATDQTLCLENLKESLDTTFRFELSQLKAEITRQSTMKQSAAPQNKLSDHDKVLILQRELGKLRILHSADQVNIETMKEDVLMLRNRLEKQKALILGSSSQRVRKSDIKAALAKAQAKALITMAPINHRQGYTYNPYSSNQGFTFDPRSGNRGFSFDPTNNQRFNVDPTSSGNQRFNADPTSSGNQRFNVDPTSNQYYAFPPHATFDDLTLHGFGSEQGGTSFSGGSSDCDYSS